MESRTYKVGDLKNLIMESSNEFKAKLGNGVENGNKTNADKAYKDAKKRGHDFDGGLEKELGEDDIKSFEKAVGNKTTLDYNPENATEEWKKRVHAQAKGYTSTAEENNGIEKQGSFDKNEKIYQGMKKSGREMHQNLLDRKKSGLQGSKLPEKIFKKDDMYVNESEVKYVANQIKEGNVNVNAFCGKMAKELMSENKLNFYKAVVEQLNECNTNESKQIKNMLAQYENRFVEKNEDKNTVNENKIKTVYFKKTEFLSESAMLSRIPDEFKNEGNTFKMKDKTGSVYLVEWKANKGIVLEHTNKNGMCESLNRMKQLVNYQYDTTKTSRDVTLTESNDTIKSMLDITRRMNNVK